MAKIAYLVIAHENPVHLGRLIDSLASPAAVFFVHLDKKSRAKAFSHVRGEQVHFTRKRVAVYWGDYSQVEAMLILLRMALAHEPRLERFVLMSGADYPIRPVSYIESFFERHADTEFMTLIPMPSDEYGKPISRLTIYRPRAGSRLSRLFWKAMVRMGAVRRKRDYQAVLGNLAPYGGATWWALSRAACEYLVQFVDRELKIVEFFRHTYCPDESMFHTILGNSPFRPRIRPEVTYADWSAGGPRPALIAERHVERFRSSEPLRPGAEEEDFLFARKFSDQSTEVVAQIDRLIGERPAAQKAKRELPSRR